MVYSSKHPNLSKILLGDDQIEESTGIARRELTIGDMIRMLDMPGDSILPTLNRISYRWTLIDGNSLYYGNESKETFVSVTPHIRVTCLTLAKNAISIINNAKRAGFKKEGVDTTNRKKGGDQIVLYTRGDLKMMVETTTIKYEKYKNTDARFALIAEALNKETALVVTVFRNNHKKITR